MVGGAWVRWGYTFVPADDGTEVTEFWEVLPDGNTRFHDRYGDDAEAQIADRTATPGAARSRPAVAAGARQDGRSGSGGWGAAPG